MKNKQLLLVVCIGSLMVGCSNKKESTEFTGNRAIVMNFVSQVEEDANSKDIYKNLANQISEWYAGDEPSTEHIEETVAVKKEDTSTKASIWEDAINSYTSLKNKPSMLNSYLCRLDPGIYITGYDIPAGQYRIALETSDHKINCIVLKEHDRIQPGNRDDSNSKYGVYEYTLDLPENTIVQLGRQTYFSNIGKLGGLNSDTDMSEKYFEGLSATDLYLLASCNKIPDVQLSGKVIKLYQDGAAVSNGQNIFRVRTTKNLQNQQRIEFTGKVAEVFESGEIKSAVIDVDSQSITEIK